MKKALILSVMVIFSLVAVSSTLMQLKKTQMSATAERPNQLLVAIGKKDMTAKANVANGKASFT